jgi:hypothetical protein
MFMPAQNSNVKPPISSVTIFGDGISKELIRLNEVIKSTDMMGLVFL